MAVWVGAVNWSDERVDHRNEVVSQKWKKSGSEKWGWIGENERIRVRNGKRKLTVRVDWIGAWIVSVECVGANWSVDWIGTWIVLCVEWIGACFIECMEWIRACFVECVEWIGAWIVQMFGYVELGSWCIGVDHFIWLGVWVGAVKLWERQCVSERGSACEREMENVWSENLGWNWFPLVFAYFTVKLKIFLVWPNLPCQPNMLFSRKWFPNFAFSQNKRKCKLHPLSFRSFLFWPLSF